jgi:glycosyltransferase involved in cell wall biosynthesis
LRRGLGLHDVRALVETVRWIRRTRPLVLHTHTAKAGALGRLASVLSFPYRPRVVVHTFHGHVLKGEFSPFVSRIVARVEQVLAKFSTRVIAVSDEIKDDLVEFGVTRPEKIEVVHLGFDLDRFVLPPEQHTEVRAATRSRLGIPSDAEVVTVIARVVKVKRIDRFLEMATRLADRPKAWFLVAGDGDRRAELEATPEANRLGDRLVWAGFERDIPAICAASDVVVLTSDNEGTPVCLIEAQAAGVPVVTTRVGGVETVVRDGETGVIVDRSADDLAGAVRAYLDDPESRGEHGRRGRDHVMSHFSLDRLVSDIDRLYQSLLQDARA